MTPMVLHNLCAEFCITLSFFSYIIISVMLCTRFNLYSLRLLVVFCIAERRDPRGVWGPPALRGLGAYILWPTSHTTSLVSAKPQCVSAVCSVFENDQSLHFLTLIGHITHTARVWCWWKDYACCYWLAHGVPASFTGSNMYSCWLVAVRCSTAQ